MQLKTYSVMIINNKIQLLKKTETKKYIINKLFNIPKVNEVIQIKQQKLHVLIACKYCLLASTSKYIQCKL
jgi:hypothetical protein